MKHSLKIHMKDFFLQERFDQLMRELRRVFTIP